MTVEPVGAVPPVAARDAVPSFRSGAASPAPARVWLEAAVVWVVAFAFRWLSFSSFYNDHFDHVARAQQLLFGEWPVRDFVDPGFMGMYLISAAGQWLTGTTFTTELIIASAALATAAALTYRLARLLTGSALLAVAVVAAQLALYPRTYSYPKLLVMAIALTVAWPAARALTPARLWALAGATALGYYLRHDLGVYAGLGVLTLIVMASPAPRAWHAARAALRYGAVLLLLVAPHLAYVHWAVGVPDYLGTAVAYSQEEAARGHAGALAPVRVNVRWSPEVSETLRLDLEARFGLSEPEFREDRTWRYTPVNQSPGNVQALLADPHVEDTHNFDRLRWRPRLSATIQQAVVPGRTLWSRANAVQWLLLAWCACIVLGAATLWRHRREVPPVHLPWLAMLVALSLVTAAGFLRSPLAARAPDVAVPLTLLAGWLAAWHWSRPGPRVRLVVRRTLIVTGAAVLTGAIGTAANVRALVQETGMFDGPSAALARWHEVGDLLASSRIPIVGSATKALGPVYGYIQACTAREDRLLYGGYAPEVFVLAQRGYAAGQMTFTGHFHASPREQDAAVSKLQRQHVPLLLIPERQPDAFPEVYDRLWVFLRQRYVLVDTLRTSDRERVQVWVEAARADAAPWPATGWPCAPATGSVTAALAAVTPDAADRQQVN